MKNENNYDQFFVKVCQLWVSEALQSMIDIYIFIIDLENLDYIQVLSSRYIEKFNFQLSVKSNLE